MKRRILLGLTVMMVAAAFVYAQFSRDFSDDLLHTPEGQTFMQVYNALRSHYLTEIESGKVLQGAIEGMLEALDDPYTRYLAPEQAERYRQDRTGAFEGIGAALQARNRQDQTLVEVVNVYRDAPAWHAGLQRGDIVAEVDGVNVERTHINDVVGMIRGPRGTEVTIGVIRTGSEDLVYFTIVRDTIQLVSVESTVLPEGVGYIHITTFANRLVYDQLREHLDALEAEGITSLILDLRDNGGGLLDQGILVADEFLAQGDIVFRRAQGVTTREKEADPHAFTLPMVVLVNRYSASASEIVAGAIQDNGRGLVIGEPTHGKGVAQSVITLADGGELNLVTFEWLTPTRRSISQEGITPDVAAEDTRFPNVITLEGHGASAGQEIEFFIDGEPVGKAVADEEGSFVFFQPVPRLERSDLQGEALVDLETDYALRVAFATITEVVQARN